MEDDFEKYEKLEKTLTPLENFVNIVVFGLPIMLTAGTFVMQAFSENFSGYVFAVLSFGTMLCFFKILYLGPKGYRLKLFLQKSARKRAGEVQKEYGGKGG